MVDKCLYCKCELGDDRAFSVCDCCGEKIWGKNMFRAIKENMDTAKDNGDLCHANNTCQLTKEDQFKDKGLISFT